MKKVSYLLIVWIFLIGAMIVAGSGSWYKWYKSNKTQLTASVSPSNSAVSQSVPYVYEHDICKQVYNSQSDDVFIPTNTSGEFITFIDKAPGAIDFDDCKCKKNSDCLWNMICSWYSVSYSCIGTYNDYEWKVFDGFQDSIRDLENQLHWCIENFVFNGNSSDYSIPAKPSFAPTYSWQQWNVVTIFWEWDFYASCNYSSHKTPVNWSFLVWWEASAISKSCSNLSAAWCKSKPTCTYLELWSSADLGTCILPSFIGIEL